MAHKIGLVFDGGGGKGAYQIGVWQALIESGLIDYVTDIAGSSVGGLNAALFVKGDFELAKKIWTEEIVRLNPFNITEVVDELIREFLDNMEFFDTTKINCFITAQRKKHKAVQDREIIEYCGKDIKKYVRDKTEYFNMRFISEDERQHFLLGIGMRRSVLLATCALPHFCKPVKIDGKKYEDGGVGDNCPVKAIDLGTDCDHIIAIHLEQGENEKADKNIKEVKGSTTVLEIVPSEDVGGLVSGTLNFKPYHAQKLIKYGYNDSIELFRSVMKNWGKETMSKQLSSEKTSSNDLTQREIFNQIHIEIDRMSVEDKYRLFNECKFLTENNFAKLDYISADGFGKMIWRVITGGTKKTTKKILENNNLLHYKAMKILECLDDEMLELKQDMRYIFAAMRDQSDSLLNLYLLIMELTKAFDSLVDRVQYDSQFLASKFSDYKTWDSSQIEAHLDHIKNEIKISIQAINKENEEAWKRQQALIEKEKIIADAASEYKLLRIDRYEACVITSEGINRSELHKDDWKDHQIRLEIVQKYIDEFKCKIAIQPRGWKQLPNITVITPAEYYMYLWFINTPVSKRPRSRVCMMDYYYKDIIVYGFQVSDDGLSFDRTFDFKIRRNRLAYNIGEVLADHFGKDFKTSVKSYRTFKTAYRWLEEKLDDTQHYTINKVDPNWEQKLFSDDGEQFRLLVEKFVGKYALPTVIVAQ